MFHHLSYAQYLPILFISFLGMPTNPLVSVLCFPACNSRTWYKLLLCPLWFWDSTSLNLPCVICQMLHSQQYSMRCLLLRSAGLLNPFFVGHSGCQLSFLPSALLHSPLKVFVFFFIRGGGGGAS